MKKITAFILLSSAIVLAACNSTPKTSIPYEGIWKQPGQKGVFYAQIDKVDEKTYNVYWYSVASLDSGALKIDGDTVTDLQNYISTDKGFPYTKNNEGELVKDVATSMVIEDEQLVWVSGQRQLKMQKTKHTQIKDAIKADFPTAK